MKTEEVSIFFIRNFTLFPYYDTHKIPSLLFLHFDSQTHKLQARRRRRRRRRRIGVNPLLLLFVVVVPSAIVYFFL